MNPRYSGKQEGEKSRRTTKQRFFSPETAVFTPQFEHDYEEPFRKAQKIKQRQSSNQNPLQASISSVQRSVVSQKNSSITTNRLNSRGLPRLVGSRNSTDNPSSHEGARNFLPSPKNSNLTDYFKNKKTEKNRWSKRESKSRELINNQALLRELKNVISARQTHKARLELSNLSGSSVAYQAQNIRESSPAAIMKNQYLNKPTVYKSTKDEFYQDMKKSSTRVGELGRMKRAHSPPQPAHQYLISSESVARRDFLQSQNQLFNMTRQKSNTITSSNYMKKLPLHMNHPLSGIKPILLGATNVEQVRKAATATSGEYIKRLNDGEISIDRFIKDTEEYTMESQKLGQRSTSVESQKMIKARKVQRKTSNFTVRSLLNRGREQHQKVIDTITSLNFLKMEFQTNYEDLSKIAEHESAPLDEVAPLYEKSANLFGLYLLLSEMSTKVTSLSPEEKLEYVEDSLEENIKELSKLFRVIMKELYYNIQPEIETREGVKDKLAFLSDFRQEAQQRILGHLIELAGPEGQKAKKGAGVVQYEDAHLREEYVREIVDIVTDALQTKFGNFCRNLRTKTTQGIAVLEFCWKLALLPFETLFSNRDFLLEQDMAEYRQKMKVEEEEMEASKKELAFTLKNERESHEERLTELKQIIERVKKDNERLLAIVRDREHELLLMKEQRAKPHEALNNYLTEMEDLLQGTLNERRKQMETMAMMADVCTVDIPDANVQMKRMKRHKLKTRRSFLGDLPGSQGSQMRFNLPVGLKQSSDRVLQGDRGQLSNKSSPRGKKSVASSPRQKLSYTNSQFLEAVEETPIDAEDQVKQWEDCETIDSLAQIFCKRVFSEHEVRDIKDMIKDLYVMAATEAQNDQRSRFRSVPKKSSKLIVQRTETVKEEAETQTKKEHGKMEEESKEMKKEEEKKETSESAKESAEKSAPSSPKIPLSIRGVFATAVSNPNFRLVAGHCNILQKMVHKMQQMQRIAHKFDQYVQIQRRAVQEGYDSEDTEVAMVFQKVPANAPRDQGVQTTLHFNAKAQIDCTKITDKKSTINSAATKLRKSVNPLMLVLANVRGILRSVSPEPITPLNIERVVQLLDQAIDEKFKDEIAEMKRVGGSVIHAKLSGGSLSQEFSTFFYDYLVLKTGLKTRAVQYLRNIEIILRQYRIKGVNCCAFYLALLGLEEDMELTRDQEEAILRAKVFFNNIYRLWRAHGASQAQKNEHFVPGDERVPFSELIEHVLNKAFKPPSQNGAGLLCGIPPCQPVTSATKTKKPYQNLEWASALSKIFSKLQKLGKQPFYLLEVADTEKRGTGVAFSQFFHLLQQKCGIYFCEEEKEAIIAILDPQKTGLVTHDAVQAHIQSGEVSAALIDNASSVSLGSFLTATLAQWRIHKVKERERLMKVFVDFDDNQDGVLSLQEFEKMLKSLEPQLRRVEVVRLYRETLDAERSDNQVEDIDKMLPSAFSDMSFYYQLGGIGRAFFHQYFVGATPSPSPAKKKK